MTNSEFLSKLEDRISYQIDFVVKHIQNLDEKQLMEKPGEKNWSVAECIAHLNSYGDYYLPRISKVVISKQFNSNSPGFTPGLPGRYLNKLIDPAGKLIKFKAHARHLPVLIQPSITVSDHITQQEELLRLIRNSVDLDLTKNKIPVSVFRLLKLSLGDIFRFLVLHNARHLVQAGKSCGADLYITEQLIATDYTDFSARRK